MKMTFAVMVLALLSACASIGSSNESQVLCDSKGGAYIARSFMGVTINDRVQQADKLCAK